MPKGDYAAFRDYRTCARCGFQVGGIVLFIRWRVAAERRA